MRGFFVGRFQPFHGGHHRFVEQIADECEEVVVGIGSAQASHEERNPFTAGERVSMIHRTLEPLETTTFSIPIEDIDRYAVWVSHVEATCPPFDAVYSNNPLVRRLFDEAGYEIRGVELYERERYSGTEIRERMVEDEPWRDLVPDTVEGVVDEIDGVERLRRVAEGTAV